MNAQKGGEKDLSPSMQSEDAWIWMVQRALFLKKPRVCSQLVSWFGLQFDPLLVPWTDASPLQAVPTLSCSELELHGACVLELHPSISVPDPEGYK